MVKKIFISGLAILLLPAFCFGAVSYERNPSGYTIQNPVSFDVGFDDWQSDLDCTPEEEIYWGIMAYGQDEVGPISWESELFPSTTKSYIFSDVILPLSGLEEFMGYNAVAFLCCDEEENCRQGEFLEYDNEAVIFRVVEKVPIFPFSEENLIAILAYIGDLFTDLRLLVLLVIGLPLGFWVIRKVIKLGSPKV